jgi:hypothetical protein
VIAEDTVEAPLAEALQAWAGGRRIVPARDATVLLLGFPGTHAPRYRAIPGGIAGATLAIDDEPREYASDGGLPGLTAVRREQSEWLLDVTLARLRRRRSAGQPLAAQTHLRLRLAEAAARLAEAAAVEDLPGSAEHAHRTITRADEILAELHGGSSVLTGSPGHLARFSALLALAFAGVM